MVQYSRSSGLYEMKDGPDYQAIRTTQVKLRSMVTYKTHHTVLHSST